MNTIVQHRDAACNNKAVDNSDSSVIQPGFQINDEGISLGESATAAEETAVSESFPSYSWNGRNEANGVPSNEVCGREYPSDEERIHQIAENLRLFVRPGQVVELRALNVFTRNWEHTKSGFFDYEHLEEMACHAYQLTHKSQGVYFTLNPLHKDLLARRCNRVGVAKKGDTAEDAHVLRRQVLLIDADPKRPSGISATDLEKAKAKEAILKVRDFLAKEGWPSPVLADSGNGYHLLYEIDLPVDDGELVKRVLTALGEKFDTDDVKIDRQVFNPARITKLYGTLARKGDDVPERPHRWTAILDIPQERKPVPTELLEGLAKSAPSTQKAPSGAEESYSIPQGELSSVLNRARLYLAKVPGAVSGDGGHSQTFKVAIKLIHGFALTIEQAWPLFSEWNQRCSPPWTIKELEHKLEDADEAEGPRGYLLGNATKEDPATDAIAEKVAAARLEDALDEIQPGWSPQKVDHKVEEFQRILASASGLDADQVNEYVDRLRNKLQGNGYTPASPESYRRAIKDVAAKSGIAKGGKRNGKARATVANGDPRRFKAVTDPDTGAGEDPVQPGIYDCQDGEPGELLANFTLEIDEDIEVQDDIEKQRIFQGTLKIMGRTETFRITAVEFADNNKLKAAVFAAGGPEVQIHCRMDQLRTAITATSGQNMPINRRQTTTNSGWNSDSSSYLVPSGRITAKGFEQIDESSGGLRVDLNDEEHARFLDMKLLEPEELLRVKRHLVEDLLLLQDRTVTYSLLAATAAAVLQPFANGAGRFALWLVGLTGAGKSFLAKLFMNLFGDFPVSSGRFATWSSTPNYLQRQGYFFKDTLYLVDDYKPEVISPYNIVRILQTYADGTARGRLKSDSTTNVSRPIRGLLLSTGEDVPEHNPSAMARSLVIKVPQREKDLARGGRCVKECSKYSGVMADFIRWLITNGRMKVFAERVLALQQRFYSGVVGQQNDSRITTNLAVLGAAFEQMAEYLADVWPEWETEARRFIEEDLIAIRDEMLGEVKEQQASEVFLRTLADLVQCNEVRIDGLRSQGGDADRKPMIGRVAGNLPITVGQERDSALVICTSLAKREVNKCLQEQGRPMLKITDRALLQQLREDGKLLEANGQLLDDSAQPTRRIWLEGRQLRGFIISRTELLGT
jgi:hypothetical protein